MLLLLLYSACTICLSSQFQKHVVTRCIFISLWMGCLSIVGLPSSIKFASAYLYTWVGRGTVRVECLAQEHSASWPGACFSKFGPVKPFFSSSVSKHREVYTSETSCMKGTCVHTKNKWIKQLRNWKVQDFAMALRARKVSGAFEKRAPGFEPGPQCKPQILTWGSNLS